jgi:hypothetical protein
LRERRMVNSGTERRGHATGLMRRRYWWLRSLLVLLCTCAATPAHAGFWDFLFGNRNVRQECASERSGIFGCTPTFRQAQCEDGLATGFWDPFGKEPKCFPCSPVLTDDVPPNQENVEPPRDRDPAVPPVPVPTPPPPSVDSSRPDSTPDQRAAAQSPPIHTTVTQSRVHAYRSHTTPLQPISRPPLSTSGPVQLMLPYFARSTSEPTTRTASGR